jgi:hypothetical protein
MIAAMTEPKDNPAGRDERLSRLERALEKAEARLLDQSARLDALGSGREESMRLLAEARADLARVCAERDRLQKQLTQIEGMQTETIALPDEPSDEEPGIHAALPSIDELMSSLNLMIEESTTSGRGVSLSGPSAEHPDGEWHEMIAPELIAPEEFVVEEQARGEAPGPRVPRLLVYMDAEHPIKYPLYKEVMTIGRSESADIQIDGDYISRIHARIVQTRAGTIIEDAGSKNGFKVNAAIATRQTLKHGDVLGIGKLHFTFVDTAAPDEPRTGGPQRSSSSSTSK